eukprot:NODE_18623_length_884_cov_3.199472.p1 GENE.NODE_18623_length_884_cov_3.199472~~NODE_18623_length_884_cov_3.199472.p1  ORF type:complete len:131 (+),score=19.62 NODE_18623_length_884_cov_3.199472:155-547(+)
MDLVSDVPFVAICYEVTRIAVAPRFGARRPRDRDNFIFAFRYVMMLSMGQVIKKTGWMPLILALERIWRSLFIYEMFRLAVTRRWAGVAHHVLGLTITFGYALMRRALPRELQTEFNLVFGRVVWYHSTL